MKKKLEIILSKLKDFERPKISLEQYTTPSDLAAELLWFAYMQGDIENKIIADLGAGTGILGIGCLLLGAKKVYFIEIDEDAIKVLKENLENLNLENYEILREDVIKIDLCVDTVVMNPPFEKDYDFLRKACEISRNVYSIFHIFSKDRVLKILKEKGFEVKYLKETEMKLKATYWFHEKRYEKIKVFWICAKRLS